MRKASALRVLAFLLLLAVFISCLLHLTGNAGSRIRSEKSDNPLARAEHEFSMIRNPLTNSVPAGIFEQEMQQARNIYRKQMLSRTDYASSYTFQGPNNLGGRTRSVVYDIRFNGSTNQTILAGGVTGGIFKSTDNGSTWTRKGALNHLFSVTSIAQDPRPGFEDTWYYATGEALAGSSSATGAYYLGNGVYKSTDNGETWTRLANSNTGSLESFDRRQDLILKVIVNPANGDVYFASLDGIYRSSDGGSSWSIVLYSGSNSIHSGMVTDIVCTTTGRLYASFSGTCSTTPTNAPGVWTSATGDAGSWTKIGGATAATNPAGWSASGSFGRVVLAIAPSNENIVYALYDNFVSYPSAEADLFKWDQSISAWVDRSSHLPDEPGGSPGNDPFAVQDGYNMAIAVKPDDENIVFVGGTNLYRSTDGFATNRNYDRIGGYAGASTASLYTNSHPDIHTIAFQPGNPSVMLCGNDGGIQRTTDNLAGTVSWTDISGTFRTYQFYYVAVDPRNGNAKVIGGAQDNGTIRNVSGTGSNFERILSGDGASVGLSDVISGNTYEYVGWQYGDIFRRNATWAANTGTDIRPSAATDDGLFITLFKLDNDNTQLIYYASDSSLFRNTTASTATNANWTQLTGVQNTIVDGAPAGKGKISALTTSRGAYNSSASSLLIGTNEGRLYRLDDPANVTPSTAPVNITGTGFVTGGYISSIAVNPRNDDTVLVTFSNYGITSLWWTGNANAASPTWLNIEGNLSLPSFRSSLIAITSSGVEYFVGTSVGLYKASVNAGSPATTTWVQEGASEIGNAIVTSLAYRPSDGKLVVGTHGYGMWSTSLSLTVLPVHYSHFSGTLVHNSCYLTWTTSDENRNRGFDVERSFDGITFKKIGYIPGAGNSHASTNYSFLDPDIAQEENYYRLKQIDWDGSAVYSSMILVRNRIATTASLKILQNPFTDHLDILLANRQSAHFTFRLVDMSGRVVYSRVIPSGQNRIRIAFEGQHLSKGSYIAQMIDGPKQYSARVVKQ